MKGTDGTDRATFVIRHFLGEVSGETPALLFCCAFCVHNSDLASIMTQRAEIVHSIVVRIFVMRFA
jgi:hypothetical protein